MINKEEVKKAIEEIKSYVMSVYISGNSLDEDFKKALTILIKFAKENIKE